MLSIICYKLDEVRNIFSMTSIEKLTCSRDSGRSCNTHDSWPFRDCTFSLIRFEIWRLGYNWTSFSSKRIYINHLLIKRFIWTNNQSYPNPIILLIALIWPILVLDDLGTPPGQSIEFLGIFKSGALDILDFPLGIRTASLKCKPLGILSWWEIFSSSDDSEVLISLRVPDLKFLDAADSLEEIESSLLSLKLTNLVFSLSLYFKSYQRLMPILDLKIRQNIIHKNYIS